MALPANFLDELRARTPIQPLIGRSVRLARSGREAKGCCPFHGEKTPSFYVYDDHFHCFGCGEHGDVISFVMKSSGASFMEAVEMLAAEAGLEVPKASPQAAALEQRRAGISEVLEAAALAYQRRLRAPEGAAALAYLHQRGLTDEVIAKFRLGWSGEGRGALAAELARHGIKPEQLIEAGLMKPGERGPVDMFFSRIMFPIQDRRGAVISFGGRILADGQPKYVNGPETPAFSKRRSLYGLNFAREAVRGGENLIVVEGYMDVIALAQAGFGGAVAPLGTALTEDQLAEIWRLSPEPVMCFDADAAGRRAALRSADLALTALAPDRSMAFLRLPDGQDPDSLIRRFGVAKFKTFLAAAQPVSAVLYDMLAEGVSRSTPEARAAFRKRLEDAAARIPDRALAGEYRAMLLERFFAERRGRPAVKRAAPGRLAAVPADPDAMRANIMTAILLKHPHLLHGLEEAFALVDLPPVNAGLRDALRNYAARADSLDTASLFNHLEEIGLAAQAASIVALSLLPDFSAPGASFGEAVDRWWESFGQMNANVARLRVQRDEQLKYWTAHQDDTAAWSRLKKYNDLLDRARRCEQIADSEL